VSLLKTTGLLDGPPERDFDHWTRLSSRLLGKPIVLVSLVDDQRQFFKSAFGLAEPWATRREKPLSHSFCKHVVASGKPLVVADARESPLLRDNPAITDLGVIAYAGVPLEAEGRPVGAFCAIDTVPHVWTDEEVSLLRDMGDAVQAQISLRLANAALEQREQLLDRVLQLMPTGVVLRDVEGRVMRTNPAMARLLGRSEDELQTLDFWTITHPDDLAGDAASRQELLRGEHASVTRSKRYRHADGHFIWVHLVASALRDHDDALLGTIAVLEDVTKERQAQEDLESAKALIEATFGSIRDGVVVLDARWNVLLANRAYADLFGFDQGTLPGSTRAHFLQHVSPQMADPARFIERIETPSPVDFGGSDEFVLAPPRKTTLRRSITPLELPTGPGHLVIWQDITAEKELMAERERQALTDALTGIANRRAAETVLRGELARADRAQTHVSIALFDIDHFKQINDRHGHAAGDEVLRRVAACLDGAKRLTDTVARWGGEEFIAILPVRLEGAVVYCERLRRMVEGLTCPGVGKVTISAGVAEALDQESGNDLLERADRCLYAAKAGGRNRVQS
jgi:diguanylate cyclase (GGDEF)-like protein/PAS domain S-box-containing protein